MPSVPASGNPQAADRSGLHHGTERTMAQRTGTPRNRGRRIYRVRLSDGGRAELRQLADSGRRRTGAGTPGSCFWPTRTGMTGAAPTATSRRSWRPAGRPPGGCAAAAPGRVWRRRRAAANRGTGRRAASTAGARGGWWPSPARSRRRGGAGGRCSRWRTGLAGWGPSTRSRTGP